MFFVFVHVIRWTSKEGLGQALSFVFIFYLTISFINAIIINERDRKENVIMLLSIFTTKRYFNMQHNCGLEQSRSLRRVGLLTSYEDWT